MPVYGHGPKAEVDMAVAMERSPQRGAELDALLDTRTPDPSPSSATQRLYANVSENVVLYVRSICNPPDPEDIVGQTWLKAVKGYTPASAKNTIGHPVGWLMRVARNVALDDARSATRRKMKVPGQEALALMDGGYEDDPLDQLIRAEEEELFARSMADQLRPEETEVLNMKLYGYMTYEQIAASVGRPVGTVKTQFRAARLKLTKLFAERHGQNPEVKQRREDELLARAKKNLRGGLER